MNAHIRIKTVIIAVSLCMLYVRGIHLDVTNQQENVPQVHEKLGKVLTTCFASRLNTLVVSENLSKVARDVSRNAPVNLILINKNFNPRRSYGFFPRWPMFVLDAKSEKSLSTMLRRLKSSDLWNSESIFFIGSTERGGCYRASRILHVTWTMDLLRSFYVCKESSNKFMLYTYHPFSKRAIPAWEKVKTEVDKHWTLHRRHFSDGRKMCENLEFDKTEHLDRYQIKAVSMSKSGKNRLIGRNDDMQIFQEQSHYGIYMFVANMFSTFKLTAAITYIDPSNVQNNGKIVEIEAMLLNGTCDVVIAALYIQNDIKFVKTPVQSNIGILTKHRNFLTPVEKIVNFYSGGAVALIFLAMFITWFIFIIRNNGQLFPAVLEVLRVILSTGVLQPLHGNPIRIFLFGIWWLVIILNATFQGHISAFLTKPERFDVKTMADLRRYNYHIYINSFHYNVISEQLTDYPDNYIHMINDYECYEYVLKNSSAACIQNTVELLPWAEKHHLHVSPLPVNPWLSFYHRPNWPLAKKMEDHVLRVAEAGFLSHWTAKTDDVPIKKFQYHEDRETDPQLRKIKLGDLTFAFMLLGIGLSIATFFFMLEIYQAKKEPAPKFGKRPKLPRRVLNRRVIVV